MSAVLPIFSSSYHPEPLGLPPCIPALPQAVRGHWARTSELPVRDCLARVLSSGGDGSLAEVRGVSSSSLKSNKGSSSSSSSSTSWSAAPSSSMPRGGGGSAAASRSGSELRSRRPAGVVACVPSVTELSSEVDSAKVCCGSSRTRGCGRRRAARGTVGPLPKATGKVSNWPKDVDLGSRGTQARDRMRSVRLRDLMEVRLALSAMGGEEP